MMPQAMVVSGGDCATEVGLGELDADGCTRGSGGSAAKSRLLSIPQKQTANRSCQSGRNGVGNSCSDMGIVLRFNDRFWQSLLRQSNGLTCTSMCAHET